MSGPTSCAGRNQSGFIYVQLLGRKRAERWAREVAETMLRDGETLEFLWSKAPRCFAYQARGGR